MGRPVTARPITRRWISLVPSKMVKILASRCIRSTGIVAGVAVAAEDLDGLVGDVDRGLAGHQLGHRTLGVVERLAVAGHPAGAPHQQPGGVDAGLHVGQLERDRLEFADLAGRIAHAGGRSRARTRTPRGPRRRAIAPTVGRVRSNVFIAAWPVGFLPSRTRAIRSSNFSLPPTISRPGRRHVVEHDLGGVRGADAVLQELLALPEPGVFGGMMNVACPRVPEFGIHRRDDDVHLGDSAVGGPGLDAVEHPLVGGLVVAGTGEDGADVGTRARLRRAERRELSGR